MTVFSLPLPEGCILWEWKGGVIINLSKSKFTGCSDHKLLTGQVMAVSQGPDLKL